MERQMLLLIILQLITNLLYYNLQPLIYNLHQDILYQFQVMFVLDQPLLLLMFYKWGQVVDYEYLMEQLIIP